MAQSGGDLEFLTLEEAAAKVRRKEVSPVELTRACLRRIEAVNPRLNAFITVIAEQALAAARTLEAEAAAGNLRGPLHGVPFAVKDLYDTAGVLTTAGSEQWARRRPSEDAEAVRRLKAAGAVLLGKLNMDEFAYNFTSETGYFGTSRNPWDTARSPGGSSGGSAIAAATGMCHATLGSDTGGSIRLPAALCGISGFKPTYGAVSVRGAAPLAWTLDTVGPMCRTARDCALVFQAMVEDGARTDPAADVRRLRVGVPRAVFFEQLDPEVERLIATALGDLGKLTAGVRDAAAPVLPPSAQIPELPRDYLRVIQAESYAFHEEMLEGRPGCYHEQTRQNIAGGGEVRTADYIRARREIEKARAAADNLFGDADILATPTAHAPAFELGKPAGLIFLRNTSPWNVYGSPTISIPCGFTSGGLPVGLQLAGRPGRDDLVLGLAAAYQRATDWHTRRPPV